MSARPPRVEIRFRAEIDGAELTLAELRNLLDAPRRITLTPLEAAEALGVSRSHFDRHILPNIRTVTSGQRVLVQVSEIEKWCEQRAARRVA